MLKSNTLKINSKDDVTFMTFPAFERTGLVTHAFSTRTGGVSTGIYSSMNLSFTLGDQEENVLENYQRFCGAIGIDYKRLVFANQTHKTEIRIATEQDAGKGIIKIRDYNDIDGLITNTRNLPLVTLYADCVPLLFLDPIKKVVGTSHAGWKGTVGQIGLKTVEKMREVFGCNPEDILVGIAPSIGPCCYEVDDLVVNEVKKLKNIDFGSVIKPVGNGKYMFNMWETNKQILMSAGVPKDNITVTDLCTRCHSDVFHSHRATGGRRGSLAAIICLR
ncbi:MAG TPA: peptidoglycan editing factor PgeF [Clostridiales bacterium]|nr:peptidoglycan editing factor PgeF [Clostridiales bacterium]